MSYLTLVITLIHNNVEYNYNCIEIIGKSGILTCLYAHENIFEKLASFVLKYPNIKMMKKFRFQTILCFGADSFLPVF
jgi:hypothetical protein